MLERIRELALAGRWLDVICQGNATLPSLVGDEAARCHLYIAAAHASLAQSPDGWRTALHHALSAYGEAAPGGLAHTWTMQKLSSILVNLGRHTEADWFARAFLRLAPKHEALSKLTGFALQDLGIIAIRTGDYKGAVRWYSRSRRAFIACDNAEEFVRASLHLVWAYCMAGKPAHARLVMPETVPHSLLHFYYSALAILAAAEGAWQETVRLVDESLQHARPGYDYVDAADICLLASRAARRHGVKADASSYERDAVAFAARQDHDLRIMLVLNSGHRGGELLYAATAQRGSRDLHDACSYTSGIA